MEKSDSVPLGRAAEWAAPFSGARLRALREQRGLSRQQLAQMADPPLSRAYIYLLEAAPEEPGSERRPSLDVVVRLAGALGVSPGEFLAERRTEAPESEPTDLRVPAELREAADRFGIRDCDVNELSRFSFRGRQPLTPTDWAHLWMAILNSIGLEPG